MQKQVCTPGKLLKNYIIDYLVWGIFVAVLVGILQIVSGSLVETFGLDSILLIAITVLLNIAGNFLVIYLTIRTLFKKYIILGVDVKSFLNKAIIFYVILLILFIVYNLLGYTSFIVETINLVLNVLILVFQFFYTRYMTMREVSNIGVNNQVNSNINIEQKNNIQNQILNENALDQVVDNQIQNQNNGQFNPNGSFLYDNSSFNNNSVNGNIYMDINVNQLNEESINQDVVINNDIVNNISNQNIVLSNDIINYEFISDNDNSHVINVNSIDNNKAIDGIENLESDTLDNKQVKTKICPQCGKEISINNNFCNICGYVYERK